jgi:hypothetical protein
MGNGMCHGEHDSNNTAQAVATYERMARLQHTLVGCCDGLNGAVVNQWCTDNACVMVPVCICARTAS